MILSHTRWSAIYVAILTFILILAVIYYRDRVDLVHADNANKVASFLQLYSAVRPAGAVNPTAHYYELVQSYLLSTEFDCTIISPGVAGEAFTWPVGCDEMIGKSHKFFLYQGISEEGFTFQVFFNKAEALNFIMFEIVALALGLLAASLVVAIVWQIRRRKRVEDNPTNLMVAQTMLETAGYQVDTAADGSEAVQASQSFPYNLILMDVGMPVMDGIQATAAIRALADQTAKVPIIAMTAHVMKGDRESIFEAGMDDFLSKPFRRADLLGMVERWIGYGSGKIIQDTISAQPISAPILDMSVLEVLCAETDPFLMPELIGTFLTHSHSCYEILSAAVKQSDLEALQQVTHSLSSSSKTFGAIPLHCLVKDIEIACRQGDKDLALKLAGRVNDVAGPTAQAFTDYLIKNVGNADPFATP